MSGYRSVARSGKEEGERKVRHDGMTRKRGGSEDIAQESRSRSDCDGSHCETGGEGQGFRYLSV